MTVKHAVDVEAKDVCECQRHPDLSFDFIARGTELRLAKIFDEKRWRHAAAHEHRRTRAICFARTSRDHDW